MFNTRKTKKISFTRAKLYMYHSYKESQFRQNNLSSYWNCMLGLKKTIVSWWRDSADKKLIND